MAKKGKLYINKSNRQQIKGFEEVIDLLDKDNIELIDHDQKLDNYETYDFLSNEIWFSPLSGAKGLPAPGRGIGSQQAQLLHGSIHVANQ